MNEIQLTREEFQAFLAGLREHDDRLERLTNDETPEKDEVVDEYVFSAHVEALRSEGIDEDVWDALQDLELEAESEQEAWDRIKAFYASRGCVLVRVEDDEYVLGEELAERLGLRAGDRP